MGGFEVGPAGKELGEAGVFFTGLAGKLDHERCRAGGELLEFVAHRFEILEMAHSLAAGSEFPGGLRASEKELGQDGDLGFGERVDIVEGMTVFGDSGGGLGNEKGELFQTERFESRGDGVFVQVENGRAVTLLVAGVDEGIESQRVDVGCGRFLLDEAAEYAGFDEGKGFGQVWCIFAHSFRWVSRGIGRGLPIS